MQVGSVVVMQDVISRMAPAAKLWKSRSKGSEGEKQSGEVFNQLESGEARVEQHLLIYKMEGAVQ